MPRPKSNCEMQMKWTDENPPGSDLPNFYSLEVPWWSILTLEHWNFDSNSEVGPLTNQPAYDPWGLTPWETGDPGRAMIHQVVVSSGAWPIEICDVGPVGNP